MARTYLVTGAASGIGRATAERLERDGHRVIDVDLRDATVCADLATAAGRTSMVEAVTDACSGGLDAIVANAGVSEPAELCVRVNYFGAVATIEGLRPLLASSDAPRIVATSSSSILNGHHDKELVAACLAGDEPSAVDVASRLGYAAYPSSKVALARWVRRQAITDDYAGAGIGINAVAPGVVRTPMTDALFDDEAMRELMDGAVPMPYGSYADPSDVAEAIAFLASPDTHRVTGQVLFVDGGADAVLRGDDLW